MTVELQARRFLRGFDGELITLNPAFTNVQNWEDRPKFMDVTMWQATERTGKIDAGSLGANGLEIWAEGRRGVDVEVKFKWPSNLNVYTYFRSGRKDHGLILRTVKSSDALHDDINDGLHYRFYFPQYFITQTPVVVEFDDKLVEVTLTIASQGSFYLPGETAHP